MNTGTPFNQVERTGNVFTVSQAKEACQDCALEVKPGDLSAVAKDWRDLANGHKLVCKECRKVWQEERDTLNRISAAILPAGIQGIPTGQTRRTVLDVNDTFPYPDAQRIAGMQSVLKLLADKEAVEEATGI